jgi:hypothetical protein
MAKRKCWREILTELSLERFREFVLPHLSVGSRRPAPKPSLHALFNYILKLLYLGCQWKERPIEKDDQGREEIHYTGVYRAFRRWEADGCFDAIFEGTVLTLRHADLLDVTVIHGDGTTTAAREGGDNIGFSGHKKVKGDKVVAFCDRNCNKLLQGTDWTSATTPWLRCSGDRGCNRRGGPEPNPGAGAPEIRPPPEHLRVVRFEAATNSLLVDQCTNAQCRLTQGSLRPSQRQEGTATELGFQPEVRRAIT